MTAQVVPEVIGIEQEVRAGLLEFARLHPSASAKMVKDALRLHDAVLAEFRRMIEDHHFAP